ncbi:LysR family transcriptional regulator [Novosphingobium profundi]|uniref:LysR family transcriptional regulator n=1 Tax=Novosphingobium profundi TaxID=1774954 RepID=UPI001CFE0806|nr:LysR family transcriptional regulator [Novosphingobium profundi]
MNLIQLKRMIAIYESGSLRKASKEIGITQPALTLSIKQLEEEFNTTLFERGPSGVRPTEMCEKLVRRARLMLAEERRIVAELTEADRHPRIAMGLHPILVSEWLTQTLRAFIEQSVPVDLRVRDGYTTQLLERLSSGDLDFAFCGLPPDFEDKAFDFEPLFRRDYAIVARADHPVFDEASGVDPRSFVWSQLSAYDTLDPFETSEFAEAMARFGYHPDCRTVRVSSAALHRSLILDGGMLGMIGCDAVDGELEDGTLRRVGGSAIPAPAFGFVTLKDRYETRMVRQLKAVIRRSCEG